MVKSATFPPPFKVTLAGSSRLAVASRARSPRDQASKKPIDAVPAMALAVWRATLVHAPMLHLVVL
jgi:hypothetical protein